MGRIVKRSKKLYCAYKHAEWRTDYYVLMDDNAGEVLKEALSGSHEYSGVFSCSGIYSYDSCGKETILATDAKDLFMIDTIWNKLFPYFSQLGDSVKIFQKRFIVEKQ